MRYPSISSARYLAMAQSRRLVWRNSRYCTIRAGPAYAAQERNDIFWHVGGPIPAEFSAPVTYVEPRFATPSVDTPRC